MPKNTAPNKTATQDQDDELPQTAVKIRGKDAVIATLQNQLAEYMEPALEPKDEPPMTSEEEDTFKKRYSDLRSFSQKKENAKNEEIAALKAQIYQLTEASKQSMPSNKEEFEAWKAKYPQIAGFIETIADERATAAKQQIQEELGSVKDKLTLTEKEKAVATLKVLVPDIEEVVQSQEYRTWFQNQPMFVQEEIKTTDDPSRIKYFIDIYKLFTQKPVANTPTKSNKLAALDTSVKNTGATPGPNSGKWKFTTSQIFKMTTDQYAAKETEIQEARMAGLIYDDTTKRNTVFDQ